MKEEQSLSKHVRVGLMINQVESNLTTTLGRNVTHEELASALKIDVANLLFLKNQTFKARRRFVKANLSFVDSFVQYYLKAKGVNYLDLYSEAFAGLQIAIDKFDPSKGFRFGTYASWWIKQAIVRALNTKSKPVYIPAHLTEARNSIYKRMKEFKLIHNRVPSVEEISDLTEISIEKVETVLGINQRYIGHVEYSTIMGEDNKFRDTLESELEDPEGSFFTFKDGLDLHGVENVLTEKEKQIIKMRYSSTNIQQPDLDELASKLGLSKERIRQIESNALSKIREYRGEYKLELPKLPENEK